jgi:hypothetical protein
MERQAARTFLFLVVAAATAGASTAAASCVLSAADFKALALSPSHIANQAEVDGLAGQTIATLGETKLALLCGTRKAWARISSGQYDNETFGPIALKVSPFYLSPGELNAFNTLDDAWLSGKMKSMSPAQLKRLRRQLLDDAGQQ